MHSALRLAGAAIIAAALAGCGGAGSTAAPSAGGVTTVAAQEKEFSISLDKSTLSAGHVTFNVQNGGTVAHEFVVIDTDTPADQLPQANGEVDEDGLTGVGEVEDIAPGTSKSLDVDLAAGHYAVICNVPGHYAAGMHADVTVQ